MAGKGDDLLWKLAESDEIEIETRREARSPVHRTTIWVVPTEDGVYIRSFKGRKGRWYQEAVANPRVVVRVGQRKVNARVVPVKTSAETRAVNKAYREKYGERWPDETDDILKRSQFPTTFRLKPE